MAVGVHASVAYRLLNSRAGPDGRFNKTPPSSALQAAALSDKNDLNSHPCFGGPNLMQESQMASDKKLLSREQGIAHEELRFMSLPVPRPMR